MNRQQKKTGKRPFSILGDNWEKSLEDKFSYMGVVTNAMREIKDICEQAFQKPKKNLKDINSSPENKLRKEH